MYFTTEYCHGLTAIIIKDFILCFIRAHPCTSVVNSIGFEVPACPEYRGLSGLGFTADNPLALW